MTPSAIPDLEEELWRLRSVEVDLDRMREAFTRVQVELDKLKEDPKVRSYSELLGRYDACKIENERLVERRNEVEEKARKLEFQVKTLRRELDSRDFREKANIWLPDKALSPKEDWHTVQIHYDPLGYWSECFERESEIWQNKYALDPNANIRLVGP